MASRRQAMRRRRRRMPLVAWATMTTMASFGELRRWRRRPRRLQCASRTCAGAAGGGCKAT